VGIVFAIFFAQFLIRSSSNTYVQAFGGLAITLIATAQVVILNIYYTKKAVDLNDIENHRTDTAYFDSLIAKLFVFIFINSYASLFYIAFLKYLLGQRLDDDPSVMVELATQLTTVFATQLFVEKIMAYVQLVVNFQIKKRDEASSYAEAQKKEEDIANKEDREPVKLPEPSALEMENILLDYDTGSDLIQDYSLFVTQYGFVTLFVAACPIAPLLAYAGNIIQLRLNAYKLLYVYLRTVPEGVEDIATWFDALQIVSYIAVLTNSALICFAMTVIPLTLIYRIWLFFFLQYSILLLQYLFGVLVEDVPEDVSIIIV